MLALADPEFCRFVEGCCCGPWVATSPTAVAAIAAGLYNSKFKVDLAPTEVHFLLGFLVASVLFPAPWMARHIYGCVFTRYVRSQLFRSPPNSCQSSSTVGVSCSDDRNHPHALWWLCCGPADPTCDTYNYSAANACGANRETPADPSTFACTGGICNEALCCVGMGK